MFVSLRNGINAVLHRKHIVFFNKVYSMRYTVEHNKITSFEQLKVWQEAYDLFLFIDKLTRSFPKYDTYVLSSQIRDSSLSVHSNIAEGFGRRSWADKSRFYDIAHGSLMECKAQSYAIKDLNYISSEESKMLFEKIVFVTKLLAGLKSYAFKRKYKS